MLNIYQDFLGHFVCKTLRNAYSTDHFRVEFVIFIKLSIDTLLTVLKPFFLILHTVIFPCCNSFSVGKIHNWQQTGLSAFLLSVLYDFIFFKKKKNLIAYS